jgi:uncharacterized caspase-like protein/tetratricopeptide (TPR) repeat protein
MKRIAIACVTAVLLILFDLWLPPLTAVHAQTGRELRMKRVVGATPKEAETGPVQLWALIIGISEYENGDREIDGLRIPNLAYAATDAKSVHDFLQSNAGGGFRDIEMGGHMTLLLDKEATKENIENALKSLTAAKPNDYFVIYVAGHGHIVTRREKNPETGKEKEDLVPYFVVHDTNPTDFKGTAVDMGWFRKTIEHEIPARRGLVLLDTCHSGGIVQQGMKRGGTELSNAEFIKALGDIEAIGFITASEALEPSFEEPDLDHGVFTFCLLEALRGAADFDRDGVVVFREAVSYLRDNVPKRTKERQHPYSLTQWIEGNYIPLSLVDYSDPSPSAQSATLVIRNPAVDGVEVAIDDEPAQSAPANIEFSTQVSPGSHKITYSHSGTPKKELRVDLTSGETKELEIKLVFSSSGDDDKPAGLPDSLYLPDKEPSQSALDLFQKGVDSFNRQKFKEAYDLFNRAIQSSGGAYSRALVYRGRTEQSLGRNAEAVSTFRKAVELKPTDFETKTLLADAILRAGGDIKPAYDSLRDVIRDYPTYAFAHVVLGDYLLGRGEIARAERVLRRAVALGPKSPPAHLILADALTYQAITEKQKEAVAEAEKALSLFELLSTKRVSFKGLSVSHLIFGGGRYANDPALAEAHYVLAKALTRAVDGDPAMAERNAYLDRARGSIQKGMKLAQDQGDKIRMAQLLVISARNFMLKEDIQGAIRDAEHALKLVGPSPYAELKAQVHFALYQAYDSNQKCAKAAEQLRSFIQLRQSKATVTELGRYNNELDRLKNCAEANRQSQR